MTPYSSGLNTIRDVMIQYFVNRGSSVLYRRIFLDNSYVLHKLFCALLSTGSLHDSCMMSVFTVNAVEKKFMSILDQE